MHTCSSLSLTLILSIYLLFTLNHFIFIYFTLCTNDSLLGCSSLNCTLVSHFKSTAKIHIFFNTTNIF